MHSQFSPEDVSDISNLTLLSLTISIYRHFWYLTIFNRRQHCLVYQREYYAASWSVQHQITDLQQCRYR